MKKVTAGILAHVDAGKTTLSEAMLYKTGEIRKLGRVDHGDSYLDANDVERNRGITVFSKQAGLEIGDTSLTLLDTPGHVDFSAEMERVLSVIDYALLIISATDGVQSHTETLWRLLESRGVPVFVFVNKMDLAIREREVILGELTERFGEGFVDFGQGIDSERFLDEVTMAMPEWMERVLEGDSISREEIAEAIRGRRIYPCYLGSALKVQGVDELLEGIDRFMIEPEFDEEFGARVFKIARDTNDERLTFMRLTGGRLTVRELLEGVDREGAEWSEKVNQIRIYSGSRHINVDSVEAGMVCAVTGLTHTLAGDAIGAAEASDVEVLEPFLSYVVKPLEQVDVNTLLRDIRKLAEEDPKLHVTWNRETEEIGLRLMGEIQLEIITGLIKERFGYDVELVGESLVYLETIENTVEGVGHFEPLRHYAEVHLILEPGERGSGVVVDTIVPEDMLLRNWQRLILTHLEEKEHLGVLIGAPITDIKITLAAGRAHDKHTNGGDFREATYRAIRNGLMKAESKLLEPWFSFRVRIPVSNVGRVMTDVENMKGKISDLSNDGDWSEITGEAPASRMLGYPREVTAFTSGRGQISLQLKEYGECPDADEVIEKSGYDPLRDVANSPDSVFVSHTGSDIVPWDEVEKHMHLPYVLKKDGSVGSAAQELEIKAKTANFRRTVATDAELKRIFERTYGSIEKKQVKQAQVRANKKTSVATGSSGGANAAGAGVRGPRGGANAAKAGARGPGGAGSGSRSGVQNGAGNRSGNSGTGAGARGPRTKAKQHVRKETLIIVDGYNLINMWGELRELSRIDMGAARNQLIDILINYCGFMQCRMTLVFDAYKVPYGTGHEEDHFGLHVVYTAADEPADITIGKMTEEFGEKYELRVVSSDALVQQNAIGHNALRISSREFVMEIEDVQEQIRSVLEEL